MLLVKVSLFTNKINLINGYGFEAIGTVRQLTNAQTQVTDSYAFDAWGNELAVQGSTVNPHRYVGKYGYYLDTQSALMLLGVRYYIADAGRFLSIDPLQYSVYHFLYVSCNPSNRFDPTGLRDCPKGFECSSLGLCVPEFPVYVLPNFCWEAPPQSPWKGDPRYYQFWDCVFQNRPGLIPWVRDFASCVGRCVRDILSAPPTFVEWLCAASCGIVVLPKLPKKLPFKFIIVPTPIPQICKACSGGYGFSALVSLLCLYWCKAEADAANFPIPGFYERWCFIRIFGVPLPKCGKPYPYKIFPKRR